MKAIVKTKGAYELFDSSTREHIQQTPRVITWTQFFESRAGAGQILVLHSGLPDTAQDAEFQSFLAEAEEEDLAVAAFVSTFEEPKEEPKAPPKAKGKPAAPKED